GRAAVGDAAVGLDATGAVLAFGDVPLVGGSIRDLASIRALSPCRGSEEEQQGQHEQGGQTGEGAGLVGGAHESGVERVDASGKVGAEMAPKILVVDDNQELLG